jgi:plastocyanin
MKYALITIVVGLLAWAAYTQFMSVPSDAPTNEAMPSTNETVEDTPIPDEVMDTAPEEVPAVTEDALDKGSDDLVETTEVAVREFTLDSFNFGYSMDNIEVNEGDTVTINLTSSDGFHDWVVDEFNAATEKINPGEETSVTFVADQAGTYEFYCSVGSHRARGMVGTLIVN